MRIACHKCRLEFSSYSELAHHMRFLTRATAVARAVTALMPIDPEADTMAARVLARQPTSGINKPISRSRVC